jgi:hypothetical protein
MVAGRASRAVGSVLPRRLQGLVVRAGDLGDVSDQIVHGSTQHRLVVFGEKVRTNEYSRVDILEVYWCAEIAAEFVGCVVHHLPDRA